MDGASHREDWIEVSPEDFKILLGTLDQKRCAWSNGLEYYLKRGHHPTAPNMHTDCHIEDHFATHYDTGDGKIFVRPNMFRKKVTLVSRVGTKEGLVPGMTAPVYLEEDRDAIIGKSEMVEREGDLECLITLDMKTPGAQKVLGLMNKGDNISMGSHIENDHE